MGGGQERYFPYLKKAEGFQFVGISYFYFIGIIKVCEIAYMFFFISNNFVSNTRL